MTTAKRKKIKSNIQSTDRGGPFLLPLGSLMIGFGFMLLLGVHLQTSSRSLEVFKNIAVGLGGALYTLIPIIMIWFGVLLSVSSKRHVSFSSFLLTFCLIICIGSLLTLTLKVDDREYNNLMEYIRNINSIVKNSPYPHSMGEYLETSYHRYYGRFSEASFYPGGGALSMLIAHPLYTVLGSIGAVIVLVILIIALIFALLRKSPAKIYNKLVDSFARLPHKKNPQTVPLPSEAPQLNNTLDSDLYQEEIPLVPSAETPAWPTYHDNGHYAPMAVPDRSIQSIPQEPLQEEGFIAQPAGGLFDEEYQAVESQFIKNPVIKNPIKTQSDPLIQSSDTQRKPRSASRQNEQETIQCGFESKQKVENQYHELEVFPGTKDTHQLPDNTLENVAPKAKGELVNQEQLVKEIQLKNELQNDMVQEQQKADFSNQKVPAQRTGANKIHQVGIEPAVELTGNRIDIKKTPVSSERGVDGMIKKNIPTQLRLAIDDYEIPPLRLLTEAPPGETTDYSQDDRIKAEKLIETLKSFSIPAHLHDITHGPTVTRFAIRLAEGVNVSRLRNVMDNLTIELKAKGDIRAEMPIPGTSFVGLEVSNEKTSKVLLREVLSSPRMMENKSPTAVALGKDITGTPIVCELMDMPHLLIAGATGSGKSVCINSIICSILYRASPRNVRLLMVDPKFVELQPYNEVPHLLMPVITDAKKATAALEWICQEMDQRYQTMVDAGVRNLDAYNKKLGPDEEPLPRIIVIVDEMADLMTTSGKQIEDHIKRITAKARAAGICLILATQRPSVNIITGVIKANIPGRIAFRVASSFDSKTILDTQGAEKLLGFGDMLYRSVTRDPIRVQGCFVSDRDVEQTVEYIRSRNKPEYNLDLIEHVDASDQPDNNNGADIADGSDEIFDELLPQAIEMAVESGQMSISMLQRVLRVGYARSGRLIDEMTRRGIISGNEGTKPRKTLMTREQYQAYLEKSEQ